MIAPNTLPAPLYPVMNFEQQVQLADAFAKSGLFGLKSAEQALALMALCEAEGMHPATAVRDYHIIQGKPAMKAEAMLARFLRAGGTVEWHERSDTAADATFSHPAGGKVRVNWTMLMAKTAGLVGKDVWKSYPRSMLHARCVSEGVRAVCPHATGHVYTPEEVQDMKGEVINAVATEVDAEEKDRIDGYAHMFLDILNADYSDDEPLGYKTMLALHEEVNAIGVEFYQAVWKTLSAKDRSAIKVYISRAKVQNETSKTDEYLGAMTGQQP